ncbi:hypothetical protein EVAR_39064_1 [Eumeta japonica]|uniref:Uncharacterized protein n=1 Tax=Eumeta variegata TaxID=151549 RepID=A0A4C1WMN1_EUMVA|nr:hypothetical protein EVAR_39064_1 [Eumeta japonica]
MDSNKIRLPSLICILAIKFDYETFAGRYESVKSHETGCALKALFIYDAFASFEQESTLGFRHTAAEWLCGACAGAIGAPADE